MVAVALNQFQLAGLVALVVVAVTLVALEAQERLGKEMLVAMALPQEIQALAAVVGPVQLAVMLVGILVGTVAMEAPVLLAD